MHHVGKIGVVGGGKLAQSIVNGLLAAGLTRTENVIASVHPDDKANLTLFKQIGVETLVENEPIVEKSDIVLIALKPFVVPNVLPLIKPLSANKLFISLAMGISIQKLEQNLINSARVIRVMPNTPAMVQSACSVLARGACATDADVKLTKQLFEAIGTCEEVPEGYFDAITALSGSGPAYVFVMIEALADGGVHMGLPRDLAYRLAAQTVLGSGKMVRDTNEHPGILKDNVTSPAGCTAAGLRHLELAGFRAAVAGAVEAATIRCCEVSSK